ncbi:MAG: ABC transporter ATP-binding protein [Anaerolineales bacterium]|nr:ABC transporter ATP-binding protein [Anaerolineales bacterium]
MEPLLTVKDLSVSFNTTDGTVYAVNNISFDLYPGETLALVGESGCGKSVTTMSLLGLIPKISGNNMSGTAVFNDGVSKKDLLKMSEEGIRKVRGGQIGFVFQDPLNSLNPVMTIGQQIAEPLMEHLKIDKNEAERRTIELLERVHIPDAADRIRIYPHELSGGMRQRVMIAIAISCSPKILIADEPTTALDVTIQAQIVDLIENLSKELNLSVIWITHDLSVVAGLADRVLVMYAGTGIEIAQVDELYDYPSHPYTRGLLGALPNPDMESSKRLISIPGSPPDIYTAPYSCVFASRCKFAFDLCHKELPKLVELGNNHQAACFIAEQLRSEYV